jgi:hypothetical protein
MMTTAINTSATSKQVRESTGRELTKEELDQTVGGGLSLNFSRIEFTNTPIVAVESPPKHWFNGG